jgi:hypothetical protein
MFLFGLLLLALTVVMLFLTSAIYVTWSKESFNPYFFQTNELSVMRPGQPIRASEISESAMSEMLIKKYVTEYFYAIPSVDNITMRKKSSSTLALLSTSDVFTSSKYDSCIACCSCTLKFIKEASPPLSLESSITAYLYPLMGEYEVTADLFAHDKRINNMLTNKKIFDFIFNLLKQKGGTVRCLSNLWYRQVTINGNKHE